MYAKNFTIRDATPIDASSFAAIYNHYVLNTAISFEEEAVTAEDFAERIENKQTAGLPWLVLEESSEVLGYAYLSFWHERPAYRFTLETSVYLRPDCEGRGWGSALLAALIENAEALGCRSLLGVIALPNPASVALHERFGFKKAAHLSDAGWKKNAWHDVGIWQYLL